MALLDYVGGHCVRPIEREPWADDQKINSQRGSLCRQCLPPSRQEHGGQNPLLDPLTV